MRLYHEGVFTDPRITGWAHDTHFTGKNKGVKSDYAGAIALHNPAYAFICEDSGAVAPEGVELLSKLSDMHDGGKLSPAHFGKSWTATNSMQHHMQRISVDIQITTAKDTRFQMKQLPARTPHPGAPRHHRRAN